MPDAAHGWIRLERHGALEKAAEIAVGVEGRWGRAGEALAAPAGRVRVEVRALARFPLIAQGVLTIDCPVAAGRVTTLRLP